MSHLGPKDRLKGRMLGGRLEALPSWSLDQDWLKLRRTLHFADFTEAFGFMIEVALVAGERDHHPEWSNVWNRVDIALTTHSAGGITMADINLAKAIDAIADNYGEACIVLDDGRCGGCG